jgi:prepilin-type N-terminal cleavage/methylation domain-containing protein/prepilin-type processing-associated H-X9-DG protein
MKQASSGFTLIEILVVIAIISILAGILLPVFSKAREKGRQITCISNLKQLGYAVMMYTDDYDETLPPLVQPGSGGGNPDDDYIWTSSIMPYVRNQTIFICPDARGKSYFADTWGERGRLSLGLNNSLGDPSNNVPYPMVMFDNLPETILMADSTPGDTNGTENARGFQIQAGCQPNTQSGIGARHNEGTNVEFLDGHAKWYNSTRIWQKTNPAGLKWTP